jgi:uncharacterized protein (DUF58 family)
MDLPLERGNLVANKKGLGQDFAVVARLSADGDLRRVDWRATARAQRLIVREFSAEDDKRVTIIFDTRLEVENNGKKLSLREKIEAEQKGKKLSPVSEKFETVLARRLPCSRILPKSKPRFV